MLCSLRMSTTPNLSRLRIGDLPLIQTHWRSFLGDIRPRSRRSEPPVKLRCVFAPFGLGCHSSSVLSRAPPGATPGVAKPHDSTSALWHRADNRPKGHSCPSACKKWCVYLAPGTCFCDFYPKHVPDTASVGVFPVAKARVFPFF